MIRVARRWSATPDAGTWLAILLLGCAGCSGGAGLDGLPPEKIFGDHGLGPGQFYFPRAIAVAPDGKVFVVDKYARIQRFSADGDYETGWQMPEWKAGKPTGLYVDPRGRLFVADTHYHRVMIFNRDGNEMARFGCSGEELGQFIYPTTVATDAEGNIYVAEYGGNDRITRFTPDFKPVASFGGKDAGEASLLRPQNMAIDTDDTLWVTDACHHRICRFNRNGKLISQFGMPGRQPGRLQYPYGITLCPNGNLLVCEFGNVRIQWFDRTGRYLGSWGTPGHGTGQLATPWGVATGPDGRIYVLDSGNHRVQIIHN